MSQFLLVIAIVGLAACIYVYYLAAKYYYAEDRKQTEIEKGAGRTDPQLTKGK